MNILILHNEKNYDYGDRIKAQEIRKKYKKGLLDKYSWMKENCLFNITVNHIYKNNNHIAKGFDKLCFDERTLSMSEDKDIIMKYIIENPEATIVWFGGKRNKTYTISKATKKRG